MLQGPEPTKGEGGRTHWAGGRSPPDPFLQVPCGLGDLSKPRPSALKQE